MSKETKTKQGLKYDAGKSRWDLLPFDSLEEVAKVLTAGAAKYSSRNWEKGINYSRLFASTLRHLSAFWQGEAINKEDFGLHHLAHAACCVLMLLHFELNDYSEFDDRECPLRKESR